MPRVFISYSWDSDEHKDRVRALATFLRTSGIDARLDQWENGTPPDGWPAWCSRQVLKADVIAIICTQRYHARFHGLENRRPGGVIWESSTIQNLAYFRYLRAGFLPIVLHESDGQYVPACVLGAAVRPLQWPSDGDWSRSGILDRIDPAYEASARKPLPLPEPLSPAQWEGTAGPSIVDDSVYDKIAQVQSRVDTLSEQFQQSHRPAYVPLSTHRSESADPSLTDLRYANRWLEYQATPQLAALERWIDDPASFSWWAVIAPGGAGKSRLALELIDRVVCRKWEAMFLTDLGWMGDKCRGWRPVTATLFVVDYAVAKQKEVLQCLQVLSSTLTAEKGFPKVRLLLLDRSSGFAPGFASPQQTIADWNTIRDGVRKTLHSSTGSSLSSGRHSNTSTPPLVEREELLDLGNPPRTDWPRIISTAMKKAMGPAGTTQPLPPLSETAWWDNVDRLTANGRMLFLELMAVALARIPHFATRLTTATAKEILLDSMINDERTRRWPQAWRAERGETSDAKRDPDFKAVVHAIGFATLVRGMPIAEPTDWQPITEATSLPDSCHVPLRNYLRVEMHSFTDDADQSSRRVRVYQPLEPDLLGERLILRLSSTTEDDGDVRPAEVQPATWIGPAMRCNPVGVAQTLNLIADDFPDHPATAAWIGATLAYLADHNRTTLPGPLESATALLLATAAGKLAVRSALSSADGSNLAGCSRRSPQVHAAMIVGMASLAVQASACPTSQWDILTYALLWKSPFGHEMAAMATVDIIGTYGTAQKFDDLERWASTLSATAERFPEDREIQLMLAKAAVNAINDYGTAQKFDDLERWASTLSATAKRFPEDREINLELAKAAVNAINGYGTAQKFDDLERWASTLSATAERFPEDREIQLMLAKAAVNAINDYGTAQKFDDLERWASTLSATAKRFPEDRETQLTLAKAAFNAINDYGTAQKFDDLERWASTLSATAKRFPEDREINLELAKAAVNAINGYGTAQKFDDLERWASTLSATAKRFPEDREIHLELAKAAFNAITGYVTAQKFDDLERWASTLSATAKRFPEDREIQLMLAKAAVNAINGYGTAQKFDDLKRWASTLSATAERFPEDREINLELAKAAVNAINGYGTAQKFDDLERWASTLSATAERFPEDREINLELAKAAFNAINGYGTAQKFDDLERWASTLSATAKRFPEDRETQLTLAKAAFNAITNYGTAQKFDDLERWKPIAARAIAASAITTDFMGRCLGIVGRLLDTAPPAATVLLAILTEYWPGFLVPTQDHPIPLCVLAQGERADQRRETLAKAYGFTTRLGDGSVSTIAEATPILQELWPLRMYLPDRGDALVPILEQCRLVDLVAEAARDPWRSGGEPR